MMFMGMILCIIMLGLGAYEAFGDWLAEPFARKMGKGGQNKKR